jgi:surfeit locus 1 family protein
VKGRVVVVVTRSGIAATVGVFIVVAVCVRLGLWQLDRRDQRLERNTAIVERMASPPVSLTTAPEDTAGLVHRVATADGEFDLNRTIVLGARSHRGTPGVYILTPLRLGDGAILVNRGWVPSPDAATVELGNVAPPPVGAVSGVLMAFPDVRVPPTTEGFRQRWFRLDGEAIRGQYPYRVAPLYLQVTGPPPGVTAGPPTLVPVPLDNPAPGSGPHLSYAVQWFSFAAIFLLGWVALVARRTGRKEAAGTDTPSDG